jgi:protease I
MLCFYAELFFGIINRWHLIRCIQQIGEPLSKEDYMKNRLTRVLNFVILSIFFAAACTPSGDIEKPAENIAAEETVITEETAENAQTDTPEDESLEDSTEETAEVEEMQNKKVLVVVARDRYQSLELNPVLTELTRNGYEAIIVSDETGTAAGTTETTEVIAAFRNISTDDYIGIILIGGSNSLWYNEELHTVLNKMNNEGKLVAAICYGSVTLATGEVIGQGDEACWYNSGESDPVMAEHGVVDTSLDVTVTGNIITGDGPNAAAEFAKAIVDYLN